MSSEKKDIDNLSYNKLKNLASKRGINAKGTKEELKKKLKNQSENTSDSSSPFSGIKESIKNKISFSKVETEEFPKVSTGVPGMDDLIKGGLPEGKLILLAGPAGSGKSTFALQFLLEGARKGENGLYISLDEGKEGIIKNAKSMGLCNDSEELKGEIEIIRPTLYDYGDFEDKVNQFASNMDADRLVIDSLTILGSYFKDSFKLRKKIMELNSQLRRLDLTAIATSEVIDKDDTISRFGVEEFAVDGIIKLFNTRRNDIFLRGVVIKKMRGSGHSSSVHPLKIGKGGMRVFPEEKMFGSG